jgi:hypothetical protein
MNVIDPALGSADMESAAAEINLIPTKVAHLRGAEPMAVCDQNHGGVAVPVAGPLAGGFLEPLDLLFGQILSGPKLRIEGLRGTVRFTMFGEVVLRADFPI